MGGNGPGLCLCSGPSAASKVRGPQWGGQGRHREHLSPGVGGPGPRVSVPASHPRLLRTWSLTSRGAHALTPYGARGRAAGLSLPRVSRVGASDPRVAGFWPFPAHAGQPPPARSTCGVLGDSLGGQGVLGVERVLLTSLDQGKRGL